MDQDTLLERIESVNQSVGEVSKRLGRLERSALPFDFGSNSSEESARIVSLLTVANDAIRRLAEKQTQPEILEEYLELASAWVPRSVLFLNRAGTLVPWRATGLDLDDLARVKVEDEDSLMARCVREQSVVYAEDQRVKDFGWGDGDNLPKAAVGIPLCFDELVPVILYGDSDQNFSPVGLEFLSLLATLVLKNHALQQGHVQEGGESALPPPPVAPPDKSDAEEESAAAEGADVVVEETDEVEEEESIEVTDAEDVPDETLDAEESVEGAPAEEADEEAEMAAQDEKESSEDEAEVADEAEALPAGGEEEEEEEEKDFEVLREEALRFARLLVSEIKLYNSDAVDEGRETSDIYDRLRHDIDRSWEMYQRRAHPSVRSEEDCFDSEVVRILASGERDLLGEQYPGPRVD